MILEFQYLTKTQAAAEALRRAIEQGDLLPGESIDLRKLGQRLRMSVTPVREALRLLESEGLVVNDPHRRARVADFSVDSAAEVFDLRAMLEGFATQLSVPVLSEDDVAELERLALLFEQAVVGEDNAAAARYNKEWHMKIYQAVGQTQYLHDFIGRLWNAFPWTTSWAIRGRSRRSITAHAEIMEAVREKDAQRAGNLMTLHVAASKQRVIERLSQSMGSAHRATGVLSDLSAPKMSDEVLPTTASASSTTPVGV